MSENATDARSALMFALAFMCCEKKDRKNSKKPSQRACLCHLNYQAASNDKMPEMHINIKINMKVNIKLQKNY